MNTLTKLDEYGKRALATRKRRAPAAKLARQALKAAIERSKAHGVAVREAQAKAQAQAQ